MTLSLPDEIRLSVEVGGEPIPGAWVMLTLGARVKNPFNLGAGPADSAGLLSVRRATIEKGVQDLIETSPMDYGGLQAWDGSITIRAVNRDRVRAAVQAIDLWEDLGSIGTEEDLLLFKRYGESLEAHAGEVLTVRADWSSSAGVTVTTETVTA